MTWAWSLFAPYIAGLNCRVAPKNVHAEIIDKFNKEISAILADPEMKVQLASFGDTVLVLSPTEFAKLIWCRSEVGRN
jgi:tripartite-type tricarboxylate transporter receptor subunit TctC